MIGEIIVMGLIVVAVVFAIYLITREPAPAFVLKEPVWEAPLASRKHSAPVATRPARPAITTKGKAAPSRTQYTSGGSTTHTDTQSSDLLSTVLILDAMDTSDNYVSPKVDTYSAPSYSSPTPSSYSRSDDSCTRSYSSYSSSDYSSSSSSSDSSSSSSSSSSCD